MEIEIQLTRRTDCGGHISAAALADAPGAWLEFRGIVRGEEDGQAISALEYEAYPEMAVREIRRLLEASAQNIPAWP